MDTKIWKSFPEQLMLLKSRGVTINNEERALKYLARLGYYRLSGYWYSFRQIDLQRSLEQKQAVRSDLFKPNTQFENIINLYIFDKKLRLIALDALERIEMAIRTDIAYLLGKKHPFAYAEPECLHRNFSTKLILKGKEKGKTGHQIWMEKYRELVKRSSKLSFIAHYQKNYEGKLPIWVAIEVWDFGLLSRLFSGMTYADKESIASKYGTNGKTFEKWLKSLNFIRNVSAHHGRLWNSNVLELSPATDEWQETPNHRPFMYFCIMQHLLNKICPNSSWGNRFQQLIHSFPEPDNHMITIDDFGIVQGWAKWDIWKK